jgi:hypothetical protein
MQFWRGDGRIVLQPNGNRVCEIESSKNRMKDVKQEFHLRELQQVEVVFHARGIKYTGPGIRISIHQPGSGSVFWNKTLPEDGSWGDFRILYTRTKANPDIRELNISTLLGAGEVQIDDVEVREPGKVAENLPPRSENLPPRPAAPALPNAPPFAVTPMPEVKRLPPVAIAKPITPIAPIATPAPRSPSPVVPPGAFGSLDQIVNSAPADLLRKMGDSATAETSVADLNKFFAQNAKNKRVLLHLKVDSAGAVVEGRNKFRFRAPDTFVKLDGGGINVRLWAYFPEETAPVEDSVARGSEVTVSGVIGRCDITTKGGLHLNIDLQSSKLEEP